MASENIVGGPVGLVADADLSAKQHFIMKVSAVGKVDLCGDGEMPVGVLLNNPDADGKAASIAGVGSTVKVVASGAISAGGVVRSDANGKATAGSATDFPLGIALDTVTTDGDLVTVYITPAVANA